MREPNFVPWTPDKHRQGNRLVQAGRVTNEVPGRVFLDTSILQTLHRYGAFIYDGDVIPPRDRIFAMPDGPANLEALRDIVRVWGGHGHFQLAITDTSLREVSERGHAGYLQWAFEIVAYCQEWLAAIDETASPRAERIAATLDEAAFGYLGAKDRALLRDALLLECDAFLTFERRLPTNARHIEERLNIHVVRPVSYWNLLAPWAALF